MQKVAAKRMTAKRPASHVVGSGNSSSKGAEGKFESTGAKASSSTQGMNEDAEDKIESTGEKVNAKYSSEDLAHEMIFSMGMPPAL